MRKRSSRFVGRDAELARLVEQLRSGTRLLTVVGPGGGGKTTLALAGLASVERAGTPSWFCDLSESRSLDDVLRTVAGVLHVPLTAGAPDAESRIGHALAAREPGILALDNFEQVLPRAAACVTRWIHLSPETTFLVTSREALRLSDETVFELGPMSVLDGGLLFEERARRARGRPLAAAERAHVATIVRRLDGMPLAIELAASRAAMLPLPVLEARLSRRFELLRAAHRDAPERHATLERAIAWSWELLAPRERSALAQCAVFRGGFDIVAAEAVVDLTPFSGAPSTLDVIEVLRDKSLLRSASGRGEARFGMLESIRDFAAARLGRDRAGAELRHARWFADRGDEWAEQAAGARWDEGLRGIERELDNLVAAVTRCRRTAPDLVVRAALALDALLAKRGPFETHERLLGEAERAARRLEDPLPRARVLRARGEAMRLLGRLDAARGDLDEALALLERRRDTAGSRLRASALVVRGQIDVDRGRGAAGRARIARALAIARRRRDARVMALALCRLGGSAERYAEALALARRIGDLRTEAYTLANWGRFERDRGRPLEASARLERAAHIARELDDRPLEGMLRINIGLLRHAEDDRRRARRAYEQAVRLHQRIGNRRLEAISWGLLGMVLHEDGATAVAADALAHALAAADDAKDRGVQAVPLARLGALAAARGDLDEARRRFVDAEKAARAPGDPGAAVSLQILRGHLDLASARAARGTLAVERARAAAAARLEEAQRGPVAPSLGPLRTVASIERRILARRLADKAGDGDPAAVAHDAALARDRGARLTVAEDARWFRLGRGARTDLATRRPLRKVLLRLVEQHLDAPGDAAHPADLVRAAWPGERMLAAAARNRLHNAVASLRSLGLGPVLLTRSDGYLLDPRIVLDVARPRRRGPLA